MNDVAQACRLIGDWTGFELRGLAPGRVKAFLEARASTLGYSSVALYLEDLRQSDQRDSEPQRLINLVTNGLTAFWRDEPQLNALRDVLREIAESTQGREVRVWSAGCATGEEAYTVAMIAYEESIPVNVLGTDINTEFLHHATFGSYSEWSLRNLDTARRLNFFVREDTRWELRSDLVECVEFKRHNLLDEPPDGPWDIILCRNVLIYHSREATSKIGAHLSKVLAKRGVLLMGSSEQFEGALKATACSGGFVYRHTTEVRHADEVRPQATAPPPVLVSALEEETVDVDDDDAVIRLLADGIEHHNQGDLNAAIACYEAAAAYDPFVPDAHCLMGIALEGLGAPTRSGEAFQKALFINPYHWFAAFKLAQIHDRNGDIRRAIQAYRQAIEGLASERELFDRRLHFEEFERIERHRSEVAEVCQTTLATLNAQRS